MEHYLLIARSITHAQQMSRALERIGIPARIRRAGANITGRGCGYTLEIGARYLDRAVAALDTPALRPLQVISASSGRDGMG